MRYINVCYVDTRQNVGYLGIGVTGVTAAVRDDESAYNIVAALLAEGTPGYQQAKKAIGRDFGILDAKFMSEAEYAEKHHD